MQKPLLAADYKHYYLWLKSGYTRHIRVRCKPSGNDILKLKYNKNISRKKLKTWTLRYRYYYINNGQYYFTYYYDFNAQINKTWIVKLQKKLIKNCLYSCSKNQYTASAANKYNFNLTTKITVYIKIWNINKFQRPLLEEI